MKIDKFEDIQSWQKARQLVLSVYELFSLNQDYSFRDQIQRAAISIMNNIAEGFERGGNKELKHFLFVAKGSCAEFRSMIYLANDLEYIDKEKFDEIYNLSVEISKLLSGFIKTL